MEVISTWNSNKASQSAVLENQRSIPLGDIIYHDVMTDFVPGGR